MIMEDCSRQIAERLFWGHGHVERDDEDEDREILQIGLLNIFYHYQMRGFLRPP